MEIVQPITKSEAISAGWEFSSEFIPNPVEYVEIFSTLGKTNASPNPAQIVGEINGKLVMQLRNFTFADGDGYGVNGSKGLTFNGTNEYATITGLSAYVGTILILGKVLQPDTTSGSAYVFLAGNKLSIYQKTANLDLWEGSNPTQTLGLQNGVQCYKRTPAILDGTVINIAISSTSRYANLEFLEMRICATQLSDEQLAYVTKEMYDRFNS